MRQNIEKGSNVKDRKPTAMREKGERCDKNEKEMIQGKDSKEK